MTYEVEARFPAVYPSSRGINLLVRADGDTAEEAAYLAAGMLAAEDLLELDRAALRVRPAPGALPEVYRPYFTPHVCPVTGERDGHWDVRRLYPRGGE